MKPETQDYLQLARDDLEDAKKVFSISLPKLSARCAYFAAFHAAEAYIYERTDRAVKTHSGVRAEFSRLLRDLPDNGGFLSKFLAQAYEFKEISDYGKGGSVVKAADARKAIDAAVLFVDRVVEMLGA